MGYRHPRYSGTGIIDADTPLGCLAYILMVFSLPLFVLLWHLLAAIGLEALWLPLGCIAFVSLILKAWFQ